MGTQDEQNKDVNQEGESSSTPREEASSQEVKTDPQQEEPKGEPTGDESSNQKSIQQLQEQVDNLNVALKQERENAKNKVDPSKVEELENKIQDYEQTIDKLKSAFNPDQEEASQKEEDKQYLTEEEFERKWQEKEQQRKEEEEKQKKAEQYQQEIQQLEQEWDGSNGKPKYDDDEVLTWQQKNNKTYLSPSEAFYEMYRNEIIDYEAKKRSSSQPKPENVEQPSSSPSNHEPDQTQPENEQDLKKAVKEAMENVEGNT